MEPLDPQLDPDFPVDTVNLLNRVQRNTYANKKSILKKLAALGRLIRNRGTSTNYQIIASAQGRYPHLIDYQVKFFGVILVMEHNTTNNEILYRYKQ